MKTSLGILTAAAVLCLSVLPIGAVHEASAGIAEGKRTFSVHCSHCHGPFGHGLFGPSLVDRETLHGNTYDDMLRVITKGVPNTVMRSWGRNFSDQRLHDVATFVFSLYGTVVEDGFATKNCAGCPAR